jgi:hypothetical protein
VLIKCLYEMHGATIKTVPVSLICLLKSKKDPNHQVLIKSQQNWLNVWCRTIRTQIHKLINSSWNKGALPEEWKGSIIVPIYKKGDKTDCTNYRSISLLTTTYKILSNCLLSRLTRNAKEITGGHQSGFLRNRSTTDRIFYIRQMLEKKWE